MKTTPSKTGRALALLIAGLVVAAGAMAEKPEWADGGKPGKAGQKPSKERAGQPQRADAPVRSSQAGEARQRNASHGQPGAPVLSGGHFGIDQRTVVRNYYGEQYRLGRCPPGLAKKNNGCMPPGQARKWAVGQPLPRSVVYYNLPPSIVIQLGVAPAGYRYVRVAADILLIAVGTGMVIDALQDLGSL